MSKEINKGYGEDSIEMLRGLSRVRDKVAVVFGGDTIHGAFHTVKEIIANSIDEAREGFGDKLVVTYHKDKSISVQDFGRGVPIGWNAKEELWNWHLVFNELYAGAKYGEEFDADGNLVGDYKESLGTNGMGAASTQYTSDLFEVVSKRADGIYRVKFLDGMPITKDGQPVDMHGRIEPTNEELETVLDYTENTTGETGTTIRWKISNDVFYNTAFTNRMFVDLLESQAHIVGLTVEFKDEVHNTSATYKGTGVLDYLKSKIGEDNVIGVYEREEHIKGIEENKQYDSRGVIKVVITKEIEPKRLFFHNTSEMVEGVHNLAFDDAVTKFFKEIAKENGIKRIKPTDYENNISGIILTSANASATRFIGQTKRGVENEFIYRMIHNTVYSILTDGYIKHDKALYDFVDSVVRSALARQESEDMAKQAKQIVTAVKEAESNKKKKFETKLRDAQNDKPSERELFIVEGDSALSSVLPARDNNTQAVIPIQGKLPNALKVDILQLVSNKVIQALIQAIGTGIETGSEEHQLFDIKKLRYSRINILTDADRDGYQIRVLLFAFFYRLMPQLLEEGIIHIVESPIITYVTNKGRFYAYTLEDKEKVEKEIVTKGARITEVGRSKGLGSNPKEVMKESVMLMETRMSEPIVIDMESRITRDIINMLFGKDTNKERKDFILAMMGKSLQMDMLMRQVMETSLEGDIIEIGEETEEAV